MFKIGEFSRFTRVSVKMLRHYDTIGLLKPSHLDPSNNYRYYSADQLPRLNRIIALKDLGFSLDDIAHLLEDNLAEQEIDSIYSRRMRVIEKNILEEKWRLQELETRRWLRTMNKDKVGNDLILRSIPAQRVASIRTHIVAPGNFVSLFGEIETYVAGKKARANASPLTIYHNLESIENEPDVEIAIPIDRALPSIDNIRVRELPAETSVVCATYRGGYAQGSELFNSMRIWIERHDYRITGPLREVYHRFKANELTHLNLPDSYLTEDENEFVTELQIPLQLDSRQII